MTPLRYVVLRHDGIPDPHFDVMWEQRPGSPLMTVRSHDWPMRDPTRFEALPDHRRDYLDYEGPVSGGRGHVRRVASGTCEVEIEIENAVVVRFDIGLTLRVPRARGN